MQWPIKSIVHQKMFVLHSSSASSHWFSSILVMKKPTWFSSATRSDILHWDSNVAKTKPKNFVFIVSLMIVRWKLWQRRSKSLLLVVDRCWFSFCFSSKTENRLCSYATVINQTDSTMTNSQNSGKYWLMIDAFIFHWSLDGRSTSKVLFIIIVIPLSILVCLLSIFVVILLKKSSSHGKTHCLQLENESKTQNDSLFYHRERNRSFLEKKSLPETYPNQSDICINRLNSNPIYSTASSQSLPSLVISSSPSILTSNKIQPLSLASRCYKSYVWIFCIFLMFFFIDTMKKKNASQRTSSSLINKFQHEVTGFFHLFHRDTNLNSW